MTSDHLPDTVLDSLPISSTALLSKNDLLQLQTRLSTRIDDVRTLVFETIKSHHEDFVNSFQFASDLNSEVNTLAEETEQLIVRLNEIDLQSNQKVVEPTQRCQSLANDIVSRKVVIDLLRKLALVCPRLP